MNLKKSSLVVIDVMHWESSSAYKDKAPQVTVNNSSSNTIDGILDVYCWGDTGKKEDCNTPAKLIINGGKYTNTGKTLEEFNKYTDKTVSDLSNGNYEVK